MPASLDAFDLAYGRGIPDAPHPPGAGSRSGAEAAAGLARALAEPVALGGRVLGPDGQSDGWVVIADGRIAKVSRRKPQGVRAVATGGVILPGLIDLHGHPEYNVFAAWEPLCFYSNRGEWRDSPQYEEIVKKPWHELTAGDTLPSVKKVMARYAEVRALVGGVTAIQGASDTYPKPVEALVRNVDLWIFGAQVARSTIDPNRLKADQIARLKGAIGDGSVKAHYVHLAEGGRADPDSIAEYRKFLESGLPSPATVVIHGTALDRGQLGTLADAGAKLIWSPQSNLRLYGETTDIGAALDAGLTIGLGADWLPSGSRSLLDELRVARRVLAAEGVQKPARWHVDMVTSTAARIAGLENYLGTLQAGRPADITIVERLDEDGYESVLAAGPADLEMVMIGGDIAYGSDRLLRQLIDSPTTYETVLAWGRRMLLDTGYVTGRPGAEPEQEFPNLASLRATLIRRYARIGPILA